MLRILLFFCLGALGVAACGDKTPSGTTLQLQPQNFDISAGLNPALSHSFQLLDIPTEHARFEAESGVLWSDWSTVMPLRATLTITEPGLDWRFVQEVVIQAYSDDFKQRREIFYRDQIRPDIGTRIDLVPADINVMDLLDDPTVNVVIELRRLLTSPPQRIPATLTWSFAGRE